LQRLTALGFWKINGAKFLEIKQRNNAISMNDTHMPESLGNCSLSLRSMFTYGNDFPSVTELVPLQIFLTYLVTLHLLLR
jgi:hypothetical protein